MRSWHNCFNSNIGIAKFSCCVKRWCHFVSPKCLKSYKLQYRASVAVCKDWQDGPTIQNKITLNVCYQNKLCTNIPPISTSFKDTELESISGLTKELVHNEGHMCKRFEYYKNCWSYLNLHFTYLDPVDNNICESNKLKNRSKFGMLISINKLLQSVNFL